MSGPQPSICCDSNSDFLQLPAEVTEGILSEIDAHQDLLALALTSRALAYSIIPQHTEYRVIRVRHPLPYMWAHLARRSDLTRNIREVHLCAQYDCTSTDRYPTSLPDTEIQGNHEYSQDENRLNNICQALGYMRHLQVFTWAYAWSNDCRPGITSIFEDRIFDVVRKTPSLRHLALLGQFGVHVQDGIGIGGVPYPVWSFSNLLSLSLLGDVWVRPCNADHVCRMMELSPDLEHLEFPMEFSRLENLRFRRLKRLRLPLHSGGTISLDASSAVFLENHPTLEELNWFPIGQIIFSSYILPSLKRLQSDIQVIDALEKTALSRSIECLSIRSVNFQRLINMKNVDRTSLRKLSIPRIPSLDYIRHLGECFSGITWLSISYSETFHVDAWFHILSCFPNLEVFRGQCIWVAVRHDKEAMHMAIMELVQLCPNLRQLDHCDGCLNRRDARRIVIIREGPQGENVRYEVRRPLPWNSFDVMSREFI